MVPELLVRSKMRWGSLTPSSGTDRSRKVHWGDDESRSVPSAFKGTKKEYGVVFLMKPGGCASGFSRLDGCMLFAPLSGMYGYFCSNACQTVRPVIHGWFTGYPEWSQCCGQSFVRVRGGAGCKARLCKVCVIASRGLPRTSVDSYLPNRDHVTGFCSAHRVYQEADHEQEHCRPHQDLSGIHASASVLFCSWIGDTPKCFPGIT